MLHIEAHLLFIPLIPVHVESIGSNVLSFSSLFCHGLRNRLCADQLSIPTKPLT